MSMYSTLLDLAEDLAADPATKTEFARDPEGFLADRGLEGFSAEDLGTALEHVADSLPPDLGAQLPPGPADDPVQVLDRLARVEPELEDDLDFGAGEAPEDRPAADDDGDEDPGGDDDLGGAEIGDDGFEGTPGDPGPEVEPVEAHEEDLDDLDEGAGDEAAGFGQGSEAEEPDGIEDLGEA